MTFTPQRRPLHIALQLQQSAVPVQAWVLGATRQGERLDAARAVQHALLEGSLGRIRTGMAHMLPH